MNLNGTTKILRFLHEQTRMTGSRAYDLPNPQDHDRFCTPEALSQLKALLVQQGISTDLINNSGAESTHVIKFRLAGELFNVFSVPGHEIEVMKTVTQMVRLATKTFPEAGQVKMLRVHLFRTLRDTLSVWKDCEAFGVATFLKGRTMLVPMRVLLVQTRSNSNELPKDQLA